MSKQMEDFMSDKQVAQREQSADHPWLRARSLVLKDGQVVVRIEDAIEAAAGPRDDSPLTPWDQGYVQAIRDYGITPEAAAGRETFVGPGGKRIKVKFAEAAAGPRDEGLDVERLARAMQNVEDELTATNIAYEYAALAKASDHD